MALSGLFCEDVLRLVPVTDFTYIYQHDDEVQYIFETNIMDVKKLQLLTPADWQADGQINCQH